MWSVKIDLFGFRAQWGSSRGKWQNVILPLRILILNLPNVTLQSPNMYKFALLLEQNYIALVPTII